MRFLARSVLTVFIAVALMAGLVQQAAAQEKETADAPELLDLVKECDLLAAHPDDPQRMAEGIADDKIVPRLAIRSCEQAIKEDASDPRLPFQLGRALLAAGKKAEATAEFRKSADAGHAAAWAYLGDAYQFGHGQPIDFEQSRQAYTKARDGGFEPAGDLVNQLDFQPDMYAVSVMGQLYNRDHQSVVSVSNDANRKWLMRAYVFSLVQKLISECDEVIPPGRVISLYTFRYGGGWTSETDAQTSVGIYTAVGEQDGKIFVKRHGCGGPIAKHFFQSIDGFLAGFKES